MEEHGFSDLGFAYFFTPWTIMKTSVSIGSDRRGLVAFMIFQQALILIKCSFS